MLAAMLKVFALPALFAAGIAYLLGSISFSIIFTRIFNDHADIRSMGSGNAGLTNVLRSAGVKPAVCTLIFDFLKCAAAVLLGRTIFQAVCAAHGVPAYAAQYGAYLAGFACILGHIYPLYFGFRGGKGILSTSAMLAVIDWRVFIAAVSVFVLLFLLTKIVSIASICAAIAVPISNFIFTYCLDFLSGRSFYGPIPLSYVWVTMIFTVSIAAILVGKHRANIKRLIDGTEKRISVKRR